MFDDTEILFKDHHIEDVIANQYRQLHKAIDDYDDDEMINTSVDRVADYFKSRFELTPISIDEDSIYLDHREEKIETSSREFVNFGRRPVKVDGMYFTLIVPFSGDAGFFQCCPKTYSTMLPRAEIKKSELRIVLRTSSKDGEAIKKRLMGQLQLIKDNLNALLPDITRFNDSLLETATRMINERRDKILSDRGLVASLGFNLKPRESEVKTYVPSDIRKKVNVAKPAPSVKPYIPEPTLSNDDYGNIIDIIIKTAKMLERSPTSFAGMKEESLRDQFLVPLNSHYEGRATGETFNAQGETDILVREEDSNVFIGECKIWRGPAAFKKAIDQLLSYTTWRDTKTAIIVFNRTKDMTSVCDKIQEAVRSHGNYAKELELEHETGYRYVFHHPSDINRDIYIAVLVFDVPK